MRKIWAFILIIMAIFFASLSAYLYCANLGLKKALSDLDKQKEEEFKKQLTKEQEFIRRDLAEKYQADMVSFEAMHKRLEIEKKRAKELEAKLKDIETKEP